MGQDVDSDHVDLVRHGRTGDVVLFISPETAAALAVLLHIVEDNPSATLSPRLKPLMAILDRKLVGYRGRVS